MYIDRNLRFADEQALTATADGATTVDLTVARDIGISPDVYVVFVVTETLDSAGEAATLTIALTTDDNSTLTSDTSIQTLASAIAEASLVAGYKRVFKVQPGLAFERYLGIVFTVGTENFTSGKVSCFLTTEPELYRQYADPLTA
jgi:hypothetical protein